MIPYTKKAITLLTQGSIALSRVESTGIRIDVDYLKKTEDDITKKISGLKSELFEKPNKVNKAWRKTFGHKTNFGSTEQLGKVLFEVLGFTSENATASGRYKVDIENLSKVDDPFILHYLEIKKLLKVRDTYLKGISRETVNGILHPFFDLGRAVTFRSSSSNPNFQNMPIRDPELGKLVRSAFIPREGGHIGELDYSGIEVRIAACYHRDPTMLEYLKDPSKDMHRDSACECFALNPSEFLNPVDDKDKKRIKVIRYCGKNMFVFPQFYGDYYIDCARSLWDAMETMNLTKRDGTPLKDHLANEGIYELGDLNPKEEPRKGTFEKHIKEVEFSFWNDRFFVYNEWKKDWVKQYQKRGYMITKTGFICQGPLRKNEIINYGIQGPAFHCLLQSLIWMVLEVIPENHMDSRVIGQIHDSMVNDIKKHELVDYLKLAKHTMTVRLPEEWDWINIPLDIEAEVAPLNKSWAEKKEMSI